LNQQIRFLAIEPAVDHLQPVHCSLFTTDIANHDDGYIALSYVWGSRADLFQVSVSQVYFWVTQNLDFALRNLRRRRPGCRFWVDAICINQYPNAIVERGEQVKMMNVIYEFATQVIACLGPAPDSDAEEVVATDLRTVLENANPQFSQEFFEECAQAVQPDLVESAKDAIALLCRHQYWMRTWTLQEMALASDIVFIYGHKVIPWV